MELSVRGLGNAQPGSLAALSSCQWTTSINRCDPNDFRHTHRLMFVSPGCLPASLYDARIADPSRVDSKGPRTSVWQRCRQFMSLLLAKSYCRATIGGIILPSMLFPPDVVLSRGRADDGLQQRFAASFRGKIGSNVAFPRFAEYPPTAQK